MFCGCYHNELLKRKHTENTMTVNPKRVWMQWCVANVAAKKERP